jgi:hypothetical protein
MLNFKHQFLNIRNIGVLAVFVLCPNLTAQNYTQSTRRPGYSSIYINTGPQNPLLNNLQAAWETDCLQANAELARVQAAQIKIQTALMLEQAQQQSREPQQSQQQQPQQQPLSDADREQLNNIKSLNDKLTDLKVDWAFVAGNLAPVYDQIISSKGDYTDKIKSSFPKYYNEMLDRANKLPDGAKKPTTEELVAIAKGLVVLDISKINIPEGRYARMGCIITLKSLIEQKQKYDQGVSQLEAQQKALAEQITKRLDAQDEALYKVLGVNTNNIQEKQKTDAYFVAMLAPFMDSFRTNQLYIRLGDKTNYMINNFIQAAGVKDYDGLFEYCSNNNIIIDDVTAYCNGRIINDAAYVPNSLVDCARDEYVRVSQNCQTNSVESFFSKPFKNWGTFKDLLLLEQAYLKGKNSQ